MKEKKKKKVFEGDYYLGFDPGSNSVGWAVTDTEYRVLRAKGKSLWGVRLFNEAESAEERRVHRRKRRVRTRKGERIAALQEIFAEAINEVDDGFFHRMLESRYLPADKKDADGNVPEVPYALFADRNYTDRDYHREYPTIYHLRRELMESREAHDVRLVYLAIHHILKHRGHFYAPSLDFSEVRRFSSVIESFLGLMAEYTYCSREMFRDKADAIGEILGDREMSKTEKKKAVIELVGAVSEEEKAMAGLITGCSTSLSAVFGDRSLDKAEKPKVAFADFTFEKDEPFYEDALGDRMIFLRAAKAIYDWSLVSELMDGSDSLSHAKVESYEKHKSDLALLKNLVRENFHPTVYQEIFRKNAEHLPNYVAYAGRTEELSEGGREYRLTRCTPEEFYRYVKKTVLDKLPGNEVAHRICGDMLKRTFMPRQKHVMNSAIPYQVNLHELDIILENASCYLPCVKENMERIRSLMTFRIPYYVGPIHVKDDGTTPFAWAERRSNEHVTAENFDEVIDTETSAERFITNQTGRCQFLPDREVLPRESLLYTRFIALDHLNRLTIDGEKISVELKQKIFTDLVEKKRSITYQKIRTFLIRGGDMKSESVLGGIDIEFRCSLRAFHDFREILPPRLFSDEKLEDIIRDITVFGLDPDLLRRRLAAKYPVLTDRQVLKLSALEYRGWGKFSGAVFEDVRAEVGKKGEMNIMEALWHTNEQLITLFGCRYGFSKRLEELRPIELKGAFLTYDAVKELTTDVAARRQVWQMIRIVREMTEIMGKPPARIFVEMAREISPQKKRHESRRTRLIGIYKKAGVKGPLYDRLLSETEESLRNDRIYLYYTQKGYCMYSGEALNYESVVSSNTRYDIDHIYPQAKVVDDSLENRVLVKREYNAKKKDNYPLPPGIRKKMSPFWKRLYDGGFIPREKYARLIRTKGFSDTELFGFIERQLIETRLSSKIITDILGDAFPDTEIVKTAAGFTSRFRMDSYHIIDGGKDDVDPCMLKVREMNDLHHAKDAYLTIVVGNVLRAKFFTDAPWYIRDYYVKPFDVSDIRLLFKGRYDVERWGEVAWHHGEDGTMKTVRTQMKRNDILVTRMEWDNFGELFDQMPVRKGLAQLPLKENDERLLDTDRYGGYAKPAIAYFTVVDGIRKGSPVRYIVGMPIYMHYREEQSPGSFALYVEDKFQMTDVKVVIDRIHKDALFSLNGSLMRIASQNSGGKSFVYKNANQLILSEHDTETLRKVLRNRDVVRARHDLIEKKTCNVEDADLLHLYDCYIEKMKNRTYAPIMERYPPMLENYRESFVELPRDDKYELLYQILVLFQGSAVAADLKRIGASSHTKIILNKNIANGQGLYLIHQSVTGVYERRIKVTKT